MGVINPYLDIHLQESLIKSWVLNPGVCLPVRHVQNSVKHLKARSCNILITLFSTWLLAEQAQSVKSHRWGCNQSSSLPGERHFYQQTEVTFYLVKCSVIAPVGLLLFLSSWAEYVTVRFLAHQHTQTLRSQMQLSPTEAHSQHSGMPAGALSLSPTPRHSPGCPSDPSAALGLHSQEHHTAPVFWIHASEVLKRA